jgi:FtsH-binding integral membrane protein
MEQRPSRFSRPRIGRAGVPDHINRDGPPDPAGPRKGAISITDVSQAPPSAAGADADVIDLGLRRYMLGIYGKVALGLVLSAGLAWATSAIAPVREALFRTAAVEGAQPLQGLTLLGFALILSPLLVLLVSGRVLRRPTPLRMAALYWAVVALIGASSGLLMLAYSGASIATAFLSAALAFGGLSLFGYVAKRDLSAGRSFLVTGLVGLLAAIALNLVLNSPVVTFVASAAGVIVFAGLVAYDTQRLKLAFHQVRADRAELSIASYHGALSLYIDFLNLFQFLLMLLSGGRR